MIHQTGRIKHRGNEIDQGSKMNYETDGAPYILAFSSAISSQEALKCTMVRFVQRQFIDRSYILSHNVRTRSNIGTFETEFQIQKDRQARTQLFRRGSEL